MKALRVLSCFAFLVPFLVACNDDDGGNGDPNGPGDTTPPAAITDLVASDATEHSIKLTWTAPGDDGDTGTASEYDARYSTETITAANFGSASSASGEPSPAAAGTEQSFTVANLIDGTEYFFAMKTADEMPNWSDMSNVAVDTTLPGSLILVGSQASTYAIVLPATGTDSVEISPNMSYPTSAFTFGWGCRRVYFDSRVDQSGASAIWGCDAFDGANIEKLTDHTRLDVTNLDGSPVEERIVFEATGVGQNYPGTNIFVIDEDGGTPTQLTTPEEMLQEPDGTNIRVNWSHMPIWSPDGTKIACWVNAGVTDYGTNTHYDWVVMDANGGNKEVVFVHSGDAHYRRGSWTPDGEFLLINHADGSARKIVAVHLSTLSESNLTAALGTTPYSVNMLAVAPSEWMVAFDRFESIPALYLADLNDGGTIISVSNSHQMSPDPAAVGHSFGNPDWAPFYRED